MQPPKREFEKVKVDEWLNGTISDIQYDMTHQFSNGPGPAVKIKITIEGYKFPKTTPWMLFSYAKKSNLYKLFVQDLVEGASEYMNFDLDQLKNFNVKVMFEQTGEYQNIVRIRPLDKKVIPDPVFMNQAKANDDEVPF